jgi:hypothetical protein
LITSWNTMSAEFKPACGSTLDGAFEILTTSAGRSGTSDSAAIGSPVSGILGMSGTVVGMATTLVVVVLVEVLVDDVVVVAAAVVVLVVDDAAVSSPPEQAAATSATAAIKVGHPVRFTVPSAVRCALRAVDAY